MKTTSITMAVLTAGALAACGQQAAAPEPVRAVRTLVVSADAAGGMLDYAAEVRARTESRLAFRVAGKMTKRLVDLGDAVRAGQVLAQLDVSDLKLGQDAAQAALQAAKVGVDWATADYNRYKELHAQGFIGGAELERRETALRSATAQFEQARAQAGVQGNQARYAALTADAAGVVTGVDAEPGAVVAAGTPVLRLAHDGPRDVVFSVPEDRVASVRKLLGKAGALRVQPWDAGAKPIAATVREVAAAADPATRTFLVKADVGKAPLRLGQTANVAIPLPKVEGITKLPLTAVMEQQGKTAVWVVDSATMTVQAQPIQVGGADRNSVIVVGGLAPGQRVVSAGVHVLTPGQKVALYVEPGAAPPAAGAGSATAAAAAAQR